MCPPSSRLRSRAAPGETALLADVVDVQDLVANVAEEVDRAAPAVVDTVESVAEEVDKAAPAVADALGAVERVDGSQQILISILTTTAFALLFILTLSVGYLSYKSWQDDKNSKSEASGLQSTLGMGAKGSPQEAGKPVLSKVGKGFAKGKGRTRGGVSARSAGASKDLDELRKQAEVASLPSDWKAFKDEKSGDVYYHNDKTNITQWEKPSP